MKIRLDEKEGLREGQAIEVEASSRSPSGCVTVTIKNGAAQASVDLPAERARQIAMALITAFGGGGDAG